MFTVALSPGFAYHQHTSLVAGSAVAAASPDVLSTIAIVVVIMLLGFALKGVKPVVVTLFDLIRTLFNALGVVALLLLAVAVLVGALIVSAAGR